MTDLVSVTGADFSGAARRDGGVINAWLCGNADQACPTFPGQVNRYHWGFDDPAHAPGTDEEKMQVFRRVRDELRRVFEAYAAGRRDATKARPETAPV